MKVQFGRDKLSVRLRDRYSEYKALLCLLNFFTTDNINEVDSALMSIPVLTKREMREKINDIEKEIERIREKFDVKVPNSLIVALAGESMNSDCDKVMLLPKYRLSKVFGRYDLILNNFKLLPNHANIAIDPGRYRVRRKDVELYVLEITLYEDMCHIFNMAHQSLTCGEDCSVKVVSKRSNALCRAAVTSSFYFVEAYLNGLAFDFLIDNYGSLTDEQRCVLAEWDFENNKARYVSFRDKLIKYPKIVLGTNHPPLLENNCPEMAFVIQKSKVLRDCIVHASPWPEIESEVPSKEQLFFDVNLNLVKEIVDNAIDLVEKIELAVRGNKDRLWWLKHRGDDGSFASDVFS